MEKSIALTVIGPEAPLVDGLADSLRGKGHLVVGASKKAALLEGSKIFAKEFMTKYEIPTAPFREFKKAADAKAFATSPYGSTYRVLKADGLAAGKGVVVAESTQEILSAITEVMENKKFGLAGERVLLEETLKGPEVSVICLTDGKTVLPFPAAQDHKRLLDNDKGPNTGGMGAYAPTPLYTDAVRTTFTKYIGDRFLMGLKEEGIDFRGLIYFGLMLTDKGPQVLEFNVRLGDPEAQVILPLIESDLFDLFVAVAKGELAQAKLQIKSLFACTVVMASRGYPDKVETGFPIGGLDEAKRENRVVVYHAGTKKEGSTYLTNGGRVLSVTGLGKTLDLAVVRAYQGVKKISFYGAQCRNDVAAQVLKNKNLTNRIKRVSARRRKELAAPVS